MKYHLPEPDVSPNKRIDCNLDHGRLSNYLTEYRSTLFSLLFKRCYHHIIPKIRHKFTL